MRNAIKILSKSGIWNDLIQLAALAGMVFTHDGKSIIIFGIMYLGACIRERNRA